MQNKRRRLSVTMSLVLGIAIAQSGQAQTFKNASVEGGAKTTNQSANWTIMVYVSADGVLTNFAVESLKQLKRAAGDGVVVAAQVDTNGEIPAQRYVFDKSGDLTSLADSKPDGVSPAPSVGTPNPKDLTGFIDWASRRLPAEHYALFLWGHGAELLLDEDPIPEAEGADRKNNDSPKPIRKYLTPSNLKAALSKTRLAKQDKRLDILGMDACSMSMAEIATELGDYANFMVASQDDVPDTSFPYGEILLHLRKLTSAEEASKMIPAVYSETFRDYIASPSTGVRGITLSAIDLGKMDSVSSALRKLSDALLELSKNEVARREILEARKKAQGFMSGLFVDIADLCQKLEATKIDSAYLRSACAEMREAISGVVVANQAYKNQPYKEIAGGRKIEAIDAAGLSIYFPYRVPDPTEELQVLRKGTGAYPKKGGGVFPKKGSKDHPTKGTRSFPSKGTAEVHSKGGTSRPLKGGTREPLKGGSDRPLKERSLRIEELEEDFAVLPRFNETGWNEFIKRGWSFILAKEVPRELDEVYSAQQCAQNLGSSSPPHDGKRPVVARMPSRREQQPAVNQ